MKCNYCGQFHAHDLICDAMFEVHAYSFSREPATEQERYEDVHPKELETPAAASLAAQTPRTADQLLELYQDKTKWQLCQKLAQIEDERNQLERGLATTQAELQAVQQRLENEVQNWITLHEQFEQLTAKHNRLRTTGLAVLHIADRNTDEFDAFRKELLP